MKIKLEIGDKPLKELTQEDLKQIIIIEGCLPSLEYWNEPKITDFNNTMFSDTIVIDYYSLRKKDNLKSSEYVFFFNFKDFRFHYTKDYNENNQNQQSNGKRVKIETIRFLIKNGYNVPIY